MMRKRSRRALPRLFFFTPFISIIFIAFLSFFLHFFFLPRVSGMPCANKKRCERQEESAGHKMKSDYVITGDEAMAEDAGRCCV